jgi:hypothetical protein
MTNERSAYAATVICLFLDNPDTPLVPSEADWDIARGLYDRGVPLDTVRMAFKLAFVRRHNTEGTPPSEIRSLAYFRTVAFNLSPDELDTAYAHYIDDLYQRLRNPTPNQPSDPATQDRAQPPDSRRSS